MEQCFYGGQAYGTETGVAGQILSKIGILVEAHIDSDYKEQIRQLEQRLPIIFPIPGATEFLDILDDKCDSLASFLKQQNPIVDQAAVKDWCQMRKARDGDKSMVPDIITSASMRREFYEIKSESPTGRRDGAQKINNFAELIAGQQIMYAKGTWYSPNGKTLIYTGTWACVPIKWFLRWGLFSEALITYKFCAEINNQTVQEAALFLALRFMLLMIVLARHPVFIAGAATGAQGLLPFVRSPLFQSVGKNGINNDADVRYVQILLNDWRGKNGRNPINIDGLSGPNTIDAIHDFQENVTGVVNDRVDPDSQAIGALESLHFVTGPDGVDPDYLDTTSRQEILDDFLFNQLMATDDDGETLIDIITILAQEAQDYVNAIYNSALDIRF